MFTVNKSDVKQNRVQWKNTRNTLFFFCAGIIYGLRLIHRINPFTIPGKNSFVSKRIYWKL